MLYYHFYNHCVVYNSPYNKNIKLLTFFKKIMFNQHCYVKIIFKLKLLTLFKKFYVYITVDLDIRY